MHHQNMAPVEVRFRPEGERWLAECPDLGIITQGPSFLEAQDNLREAILLFFESCIRRGTLERVLFEAGFEPVYVKKMQDYAGEHIPTANIKEARCHG